MEYTLRLCGACLCLTLTILVIGIMIELNDLNTTLKAILKNISPKAK